MKSKRAAFGLLVLIFSLVTINAVLGNIVANELQVALGRFAWLAVPVFIIVTSALLIFELRNHRGEGAEGRRLGGDLIQAFHKKLQIRILLIAGVTFALLLNPLAIEYVLKLWNLSRPGWYTYALWGAVTASLFAAALVIALLAGEERVAEPLHPTSIIKGLLPYTEDDASWFAMLQRGGILHECMSFCSSAESSFAILSGDSGTGKTSFLRAGLVPHLTDQGRRPFYVKLTTNQPFNAIRESLKLGGESPAPDVRGGLLELLKQVTSNDGRHVILILDQFEQFFTHLKTRAARFAFVQQMAEWHEHGKSMPVKILISVRADFADRLTEFQKEMGYTLTPHNKFRLEKFEPQEAADVIGVIAREADIEFDETFVQELARHELAGRGDGTVSPVDIQILSWMINEQRVSGGRAFNRKAFQKLGGVEGLLQRFLDKALSARESEARRQAAIKVMLALTDENVRAGALSLKEVKERLNGAIPDRAVEEALSWLTRGEVRLVTQVRERNTTLYELAHERIIPPLRRLAFKEITDVEEARQTLDRRVNEWIGNNRARRYLLTFKEWMLIRRHWVLITLGPQKKQKEEFVALSRRRFTSILLSFGAALVIGLGGYAVSIWYESRPETQINRAERRLAELLDRNKNFNSMANVSLLLPMLESEKEQELTSKVWQLFGSLGPDGKPYTLGWLAQVYGKYGKAGVTSVATDGLVRVLQEAEKLGPGYKAYTLSPLAQAYGELPQTGETVEVLKRLYQTLDEFWPATQTLGPDDKYRSWSELVAAYGKLPATDETLSHLEKIREAAAALETYVGASLLPPLAAAYVKMPQTNQSIEALNRLRADIDRVLRAGENFDHNMKPTVLAYAAEAYGHFKDKEVAVKGLDRVLQMSKSLDIYAQSQALKALAESYSNLQQTDEAMSGLDKVHLEVERRWKPTEQFDPGQLFTLMAIAQGYSKVARTDEDVRRAVDHLDRILQMAEILIHSYQSATLRTLAEAYDKLPKSGEAMNGLDRVQRALDVYWQGAKEIERADQADVLQALAETYGDLPKIDEALSRLNKIRQGAEKLVPSYKARVQLSLAETYVKLEKPEEALKYLAQSRQATNDAPAGENSFVLGNIAILYAKLHKWREALETAYTVNDELYAIKAFSRILIIWKDVKHGTRTLAALEEMFTTDPYSYRG
jgi:hypothetical protein